MTRWRQSGLVVFMALLVGGMAGWVVRGNVDGREADQVALARCLERIAFSANALTLAASRTPGRLEKVLWQGLESNLAQAEEDVASGVRMSVGFATPNLIEGLRRAEAVAERSARPALAARLASLLASVGGEP